MGCQSPNQKAHTMLRFLFCLLFITPVFILPSLLGNQDATASIEAEQDTYETFIDTKVAALSGCEPDNVPVYFRNEYVETHSAEFLHTAVDAASECFGLKATVMNLKFENMTEAELELADDQAEEVSEFLNAYDNTVEVERGAREIELDTRAVNGRAVIVEFNFEQSIESASAAQ